MNRAWRWPFAGFVVGALVGATILTVNVIGASSPVRPPAGTGSFGEILHTPALLARAGEPVRLRYDFVCGVPRFEPAGGCSPSGSVFVRPAGRAEYIELPLRRDREGLLSATVGASDAAGGFDYYARIDNGRGQSAELPGGAPDAPHHVWPIESLDEGRSRRSSIRADTGAGFRRRELPVGEERSGGRARQRPRAGADRAVGVRRRSGRLRRRARPSEPPPRDRSCRQSSPAHVPIAFDGGEGDLAVAPDGTIYVLDSSGHSDAAVVHGRRLSDRGDAPRGADGGHGASRPERATRPRVSLRDVAPDGRRQAAAHACAATRGR